MAPCHSTNIGIHQRRKQSRPQAGGKCVTIDGGEVPRESVRPNEPIKGIPSTIPRAVTAGRALGTGPTLGGETLMAIDVDGKAGADGDAVSSGAAGAA
jgi:hypothetical protein